MLPRFLTFSLLLLSSPAAFAKANTADHVLWYRAPAIDWMTEALPIGNGSLGAMVFGGVNQMHLQFNQNTLWLGDEKDTGMYQAFGDVFLQLEDSTVTQGSSQSVSPDESVSASVDGSTDTKWCLEHHGQEVIWVKHFSGAGVAINSYALTSADDVPERDPQTWVLEGSMDGTNWTQLDSHTKEGPFPQRKMRKVYNFSNTTAYSYYRFRFQPNTAVPHFQVAEIELGDPLTGTTGYRRELDLNTAVHRTSYEKAGVHYERTVFASHPAQVIVMRLTADKPGAYSGRLSLTDMHNATVTVDGNRITATGKLSNGMEYESQLLAVTDGGKIEAGTDETHHVPCLVLDGCNSVTLFLAADTNYVPDFSRHWRGPSPGPEVTKRIDDASPRPFAELLAEHIVDYRGLYNRFQLNLGSSPADQAALPTDERLSAYSKSKATDPELETLFCQYGRYLLISCSRPGGLPANLQGLWNDSNTPIWRCDYHSNINIQMNYWLSEVTNLSLCDIPFIDYVDSLREVRKIRTREHYGQNVRGWTVQTENGIEGGSTFTWNPPGSAWYAQQLWEHYAFTNDKQYLQQTAYPILKEVCEFWEDHLKLRPDGTLISPDGWSPEHGPVGAGDMYDQEIVYDLFTNYIKAADVLNVDKDYRDKIAGMRDKLLKLKIGKYGQLQEWEQDIDDMHDQYRHASHLFALYPGKEISPLSTPALSAAAKVSLLARGDGGTGWSRAWKISFWARFLDGDHAYTILRRLLTLVTATSTDYGPDGGGVYANLLDAHPPFQIDGNLGGTAGIAEMLLQSQDQASDGRYILSLLPALPHAWPDGDVKGICARGGFEVDMAWHGNQLQTATIHSTSGTNCEVAYQGKTVSLRLTPGQSETLDGQLAQSTAKN